MFKKSIVTALALLAVGGSWLTAQQVIVHDVTTTGTTAGTGPDYWTDARRTAALPRALNIAGNPAPGPGTPVSPVVKSPGQKAAMMESPFDLMNDAVVPQAFGIQPQEAGAFATYPYPFTRLFPWGGLYSGGYAFWPIQPYRMVGKLFFTLRGSNYVCSASVIRPHLLLTARHCIYDGTWATNVTFYPGYANGANPKLKSWKARRLGTWSIAGSGALLKWDIGFIQTFDDDGIGCNGSKGGKAVEWYTGFLGWMYGGSVVDRNYTALGYPHAAPFDGKWLAEAHSDVGNVDPLSQPGTFSMGSDLTGGSSGGPWLVGFGSTNYANGLNSYKWTTPSRPLEMNSPNFQSDNFYNLLAWAQAWTCP